MLWWGRVRQMVMGSTVDSDQPTEEAGDGKRRKLFLGTRKSVIRKPFAPISSNMDSSTGTKNASKEDDINERLAKRMKIGINISPIRSKGGDTPSKRKSIFETTNTSQPAKVYKPSFIADGPPPVFSFSKPPAFIPPVFTVPLDEPLKTFTNKQKERRNNIMLPTANVNKRMGIRTRQKAVTLQKNIKNARSEKFSNYRRQHAPPDFTAKDEEQGSKEAEEKERQEKERQEKERQEKERQDRIQEKEVLDAVKRKSEQLLENERKQWLQREQDLKAELEKERQLRQMMETKLHRNNTKQPQSNQTKQEMEKNERKSKQHSDSTTDTRQTENTHQKDKKQKEQEEKERNAARTRKQKEEKAQREKDLQERVKQRKQEMDKQEASAQVQARQRQHLLAELAPLVKARFGNKSYMQLCMEFLPRARLPAKPDRDEIRRTLRRAMARYHPDKARHLNTFREQVESELIFEGLKEAYQEMVEYCKVHGQ